MASQNVVDLDGDESILPSQNTIDENELNSSVKTKKRSRKYSTVWNYFEDLGKGKDGKPRARCIACKEEYIAGGSTYGISSLKRHSKKCNLLKARFQDVSCMLNNEGKVTNRLSHKLIREKLAMAIIKHDLPFSFVEYDAIWELLTYCNHKVKKISRNTAASDVYKQYVVKKENLKTTLANLPSRICLTSDLWTACTSEGYICLTAHFIDADWRLHNYILSFIDFPPPHNGVELARKVHDLLKEWGIERKIFSITLDNASSNDNMQGILCEQLKLQNYLLCDGAFFHIRCSAHILNLIVQEGLKVAGDALHKIRESIKYVKGSEARKNAFKECVKQSGLQIGAHLRLDVSTRWNSTYVMLDSALRYQRAFSYLALSDRNYKKYCPSMEEWTRGKKMCDFLRPFFEITKLISGSSYPTSNLYFMRIWKIQHLLTENVNNEDIVIKDMVKGMKIKFDKYWAEYSNTLALGAVFDPRVKLELLEMCYKKIDEESTEAKMKTIKDNLELLFEQYSKSSSNGSNYPSFSVPPREKEGLEKDTSSWNMFSTNADFKMLDSQVTNKAGKSQLEVYLDESRFNWNHHADLDVLKYWKSNAYRFPELALFASDILSIPITTVASESAFSIGSRVLNKYRSSLLPKNVQALICVRSWMHGFIPEEEDDDEVVIKEPTSSQMDSNMISGDEDEDEDDEE